MENKITNKMRIVKNAVVGFAVGVMWELVIITPLMSDWTLRSIIVALMLFSTLNDASLFTLNGAICA